MEPTCTPEDDPNVTDKKCAGNPSQSYRTREPMEAVGELVGWASR
ncbi:NAD(+)--rifampin ADP-ribosyltransferase [Arthrobacter sp. 2MCAF15]